jgi:hypothetical protein
MCCLSLSLEVAVRTLRVLLERRLPLCSARTKVAKEFLTNDLNSINLFAFIFMIDIISIFNFCLPFVISLDKNSLLF